MGSTKPASKAAIEWRNRENSTFYEDTSADMLNRQAAKVGIAHGEDFQEILPLLEQLPLDEHSRFLEIGAGTGRMVELIHTHFPDVQILALERSAQNLKTLSRRFHDRPNVTILGQDLLQLSKVKPCHVGFWMFSGIVEFHPSERVAALSKVRQVMAPNSLLFVEVAAEISGRISSTDHEDGFAEVHIEGSTIRLHVPGLEELEETCLEAGWNLVGTLEYETSTGIPRYILVLQNPR